MEYISLFSLKCSAFKDLNSDLFVINVQFALSRLLPHIPFCVKEKRDGMTADGKLLHVMEQLRFVYFLPPYSAWRASLSVTYRS